MEQTKALTALEPFLALTKSATSPLAAIDLIQRATKAPGTYIFTELLLSPPIAALATSDDPTHRAWHTHLSLFSHGLYTTYLSTTPALPALDAAQTLKLRQLSLLTLSRDKSQLTYPALLRHLHLTSARDLEDVVISAVYAGVLSARLNPARGEVQVSSVAPLRDVAPENIPGLVAVLSEWSARCDNTLAELEATLAGIRADAADALQRQRDDQALVTAAIEAEEKADGIMRGGAACGGRTLGHTGPVTRIAAAAARMRGASLRGHGAGAAVKRGMMEVEGADEEDDEGDEAMDLDGDEQPGGGGGGGGEGKQKLARRRKL